MIDVQNLTKRYGRDTAVDDLTFTVRPGAVTGFLGPNGAGKSTTMRMMLALTRPDAGSVRVNGVAYRELTHPLRQVGALLETAAPHRALSAARHLRWLARSNRIDLRRVEEVLDLVGLTDVAGRRIGTFSLGMGQRLGLAAALLGDPPVLVLDEPLNGLDTEGIRQLRGLLRTMAAEGRTVLVSSHLMTEMSLVADHLVVIDRGRLRVDTAMADFVRGHGRTHVRVRTPEPLRLQQELRRRGVTPRRARDGALEIDGMSPAEISALAAAHTVPLEELSTHTGSLEEAFLGLVAGGGDGSRGRSPGRAGNPTDSGSPVRGGGPSHG
ncbi:ABC transporter ATP-binding protein [Streptomyces sp. NPDC004111]|uniref:ABC transporter ATP-binding protein n=1 Tax=Streptomyces sp. NPDC004111 TaxID=3364690 RepID=UPI0036985B32